MSEHEYRLQPHWPMFTACCSCGWESTFFDQPDEADDAWDNHCDVVFMEATEGLVW